MLWQIGEKGLVYEFANAENDLSKPHHSGEQTHVCPVADFLFYLKYFRDNILHTACRLKKAGEGYDWSFDR